MLQWLMGGVEPAETDTVEVQSLLHSIEVSRKRLEAAEKGQRTFWNGNEKRRFPLKGLSRVERVVPRGRRTSRRGREGSNYSGLEDCSEIERGNVRRNLQEPECDVSVFTRESGKQFGGQQKRVDQIRDMMRTIQCPRLVYQACFACCFACCSGKPMRPIEGSGIHNMILLGMIHSLHVRHTHFSLLRNLFATTMFSSRSCHFLPWGSTGQDEKMAVNGNARR